MRHFRKIDLPWLPQALPVMREELERQEDAWTLNESRQTNIKVQRHTQTIFLRSVDRTRTPDLPGDDIQESKATQYSRRFPTAMQVLQRLAAELDGELGRAVYTRLLPGHVVYPHIDKGSYYAVRDRYHLVMVSKAGSCLRCGGEELLMRQDELWWFDNKALHDSRNDSQEWRTHLIFDLLPVSRAVREPMPAQEEIL